jgi:imidazolonepropionase-like amidohydrolase
VIYGCSTTHAGRRTRTDCRSEGGGGASGRHGARGLRRVVGRGRPRKAHGLVLRPASGGGTSGAARVQTMRRTDARARFAVRCAHDVVARWRPCPTMLLAPCLNSIISKILNRF